MAISPSSSIQAARERLAARLLELRLEAAITGQELSDRCGWSAAKTSRIEHAKTPPSDADIRTWCRACGAEDQAPDLVAANRAADEMYVHWKRLHRHGMRRAQDDVMPLYERTDICRIYTSTLMPGVVQTHAYAAAVLATIAAFQQTPDDSEEAATARTKRARFLNEGRHRYAFLLEESVLYHHLGTAETMAGQLSHLLSVMTMPNVSLGIVPLGVPRRPIWPLEAFYAFDDAQVSTELLTAAVNITTPSEVAVYLKAFAGLSTMAVYGSSARALITTAIRSLGWSPCKTVQDR